MTINYMDLQFIQDRYNRLIYNIGDEHPNYVPNYDDVLKALRKPKNTTKTKVLILGQDPYPTPGHANGLAFSVKPDVHPLPRSLKNIFKELVDDIGCPYPTNGDLTPWTEEGVLLLNSCLTTDPFKPGAHQGLGWESLATEVIEALSNDTKRRVFILWGREAQKYENLINQDNHLVIKSVHPSPLSANYGFFGSKPFSRANAYLRYPVDWSLENQPQPVVTKKKRRASDLDWMESIPDTQPLDPYWSTRGTDTVTINRPTRFTITNDN
jgi:uracil-DNA glycosylase